MAQHLVVGPAGIAHLGDQRRPGPMHPLDRGALRQSPDRGRGAFERAEPRPQLGQLGVVEAGADAAGIMQGAVPVVIAEQQRAQTLPAAGRVGEADHDELVAVGGI